MRSFAMSWIAVLPLVLMASLVVVLFPLGLKNGNRPLPVGLEDDPGMELEHRRVVLLAQLKEMEQEGGDQGLEAGKEGLEAELADVFGQLDRTAAVIPAGGMGVAGGDGRVSGVDKGFAAAFVLFAATFSTLLYVLMGTTEKIELPSSPHVESSAQINQMLDQAVQKLKQEPGNLEGWMRLARSFAVVQRTREAIQAYSFIVGNHPRSMEARVALAELKVQAGESEDEIKEGAGMFRAILAEDPNQQDALWFLGGLAMRAGAKDEAADYWNRLLQRLPPDDPNREMIQQALTDLKKQ
ncbi:MAG: tetratricopeptide repeat protein [Magnetococcales bacterium]|nr:tetratricopeptide repeat protein [Magnetococcales bacterium]